MMPWLVQQHTPFQSLSTGAVSASIYILPYHMKLEALITLTFTQVTQCGLL